MTTPAAIALANRRQRAILRIGSVYDGGFGVALFLMPATITSMLALPDPDVGGIWLRLDGIFLMVLCAVYWIMSQDPQRYLGIMAMILPAKLLSIVFYLTYVFAFQASKTFCLFAVLDAVMFSLHWWALGPGGIARIRDALKPAALSAG
jgi:hypothetical protein